VTRSGVTVNRRPLPHSRPAVRDRSGPVARVATRSLSLGPERVWLYAPVDRRWDSRYWGPAAAANLLAEATPVFVALGGTGPLSV